MFAPLLCSLALANSGHFGHNGKPVTLCCTVCRWLCAEKVHATWSSSKTGESFKGIKCTSSFRNSLRRQSNCEVENLSLDAPVLDSQQSHDHATVGHARSQIIDAMNEARHNTASFPQTARTLQNVMVNLQHVTGF